MPCICILRVIAVFGCAKNDCARMTLIPNKNRCIQWQPNVFSVVKYSKRLMRFSYCLWHTLTSAMAHVAQCILCKFWCTYGTTAHHQLQHISTEQSNVCVNGYLLLLKNASCAIAHIDVAMSCILWCCEIFARHQTLNGNYPPDSLVFLSVYCLLSAISVAGSILDVPLFNFHWRRVNKFPIVQSSNL